MKVPIVVIAVCAGVIAATTRPPGNMSLTVQTTAVPNETVVRLLGRPVLSLVVDLAWVRTIAFSQRLSQPVDGKVLIEWCLFITELDRRFRWAYLLGGLLGPMEFGEDTYNGVEADRLLSRGVEAFPDEYQFATYLAYNQLYLERDPLAAGKTLMNAARVPGAPPFVSQLASRLLAQGGDYATSQRFALEMAAGGDGELRGFFEHRARAVLRDERRSQLQAAVDAFRQRRNVVPASLEEVQREGLLLGEIPEDPLGGSWSIDDAGVVRTNSGEALRVFEAQN